MAFESIITDHFRKKFHDLTDKNNAFKIQIVKKLAGIDKTQRAENPKVATLGDSGVCTSQNTSSLSTLSIKITWCL